MSERPSQPVMYQGFLAVGQRPEELQNALVLLQSRPEPPDMAFPIICTTLAAAASEVDIATLERITSAFPTLGRQGQGVGLASALATAPGSLDYQLITG